MTDRYHSLTVVLDKDLREDDAEVIISAIKCLRSVVSVTGNVSVADYDLHVAQVRARMDIIDKLNEALYPKNQTK